MANRPYWISLFRRCSINHPSYPMADRQVRKEMDCHHKLYIAYCVDNRPHVRIRYNHPLHPFVSNRSNLGRPNHQRHQLACRVAASLEKAIGCLHQDDDRNCLDHTYYSDILVWNQALAHCGHDFYYYLLHRNCICHHLCSGVS